MFIIVDIHIICGWHLCVFVEVKYMQSGLKAVCLLFVCHFLNIIFMHLLTGARGIKQLGCPGMQLSVHLSLCESVFRCYILDSSRISERFSIKTCTNTSYLRTY